ncbi:tight junction protein ZO-1-like isoform X4 [Dreissena polymorpha]|uniref:tight junction protein ZO-1-like isoform X4 n=1 Tax=Dreissena polymorpha TaxID=45954 RepID=UPI002263B84C|nr:tight junction protein ZO-1-like isoform X4 [Dreissena polymorpha]
MRQAQQFLNERDKALASLENLSAKRNNTPIIERRATSPTRRNKDKLKAVDSDLEIENEENSDNVVWETHKVTLTRVPGFGFGIAVSGGKDNPHFANGDPSIAISDVLKSGPAEGKLQINDRVLSVNGNSLENVDHSTAISVLKDCGSTVNLVIRRRIVLPASLETETPPLKVTLSKRNRKDEYGVVLGCRFFIKEILPNSLAAEDGGLKEGDTILKINNAPIDSLSLIEARKLIEKTKDKLQFIITKPRDNERRKDDGRYNEYSLGYGTMQSTLPKHADKVYQTKSNIEDSPYKAQFAPQDIPPGAYPANSPHSRYDGRYIYDHEAAPPRPPLPSGIDNSGPPRSPSPVKGGYLSDGEDRRRKQSYGNYATVDETDIPILRRHHEERYVGKRKDIRPDPRIVTFLKDPELGLGLRLAGGNATGIFIASVQPNTAAEIEGLSEGDQIIKANTKEIVGLTREEAVMSLTSLQGTVSLEVQYKKEELDRIMSSQEAGDSFYIRTHFNHEQLEPGELSFVQGDIFHIKDTLFRGVVGSWLAVRMGRNNQETQKGIIPNKNRAEQLAISSQCRGEDDKDNSPSKRSGLFKRKVARRSKSLSKDHWEDVIFSHLQTKFPAYERVLLRDCGFVRPVVIFGPLADVAREKILKDFPDKFQSPQSEHRGEDQKKGRTGIIRLGAIKDVINRRKHCMLDITPHNVDRLNFAQFYPIVVFLKADCKTTVKELRAKWAKGSSKNPKKLYEHSIKLDKFYQHLFTATVTHNTTETWYRKLVEMVDLQQQQQIWMSEKKPEEDISDDYLFPLSNRLSFSGSHGDASDNDVRHAFDDMDALPAQRKRQLVRSSSDPSVNTMDRVPGIPPYPDPPRYQRQPKLSTDGNQNYQDIAYDDSYTQRSEDRYYPSYYADHNDVDRRLNRHNIDPYATITPSERLRGRMPSDPQWSDGFDDRQPPPPQAHQNEAVYSKPLPRQRNQLSPGNQGHTGVNEPGSPGYGPSSGQQHLPPPPPPHQAYTDSSSYSSDSFTKYTSNPVNKHDDSKLRDKMGQLATRNARSNDPYRDPRDTDVNHMRAGSGSSQTGSAFESYSKASPLSSFGKAGELGLGPKSPVKLGQDSQPLPSKSSGDELSAVLETSEPSSNNEDETAVNGHVTSLDQSNASVLSHDTSHDCAFQSNVVVTHNGFEDHLNKAVESFDMLLDKMNQLENGQKSPDQDSQSETVSTPDTVILRGGFDPTQDLDDSHTVVATARGLFNKQGGVLESPETGVSIVIPPGALSGDQDQEIYFKVCRDNSILPPLDREKGETLLSPLVMCGPHGLKFNQPVELRLPHCASVNPDSWSFALKSSDSPSGQPTQWQNMTLAEREGQMQSRVGKNSVSVLVDHF